MALLNGEPLSFRTLHAILGASLLTVFNTGTVQRTTNGVVTNTWQVFYTTATDQHNGVLLQVVTFTTDIGGDFEAVGQTYTAYFTQCRVRLLRGGGIYTSAHATLLRARFQRRHVAFNNELDAWLANQLVNSCHQKAPDNDFINM
ncbi:hypothetical protein WH06_17080 [Aeromonas salmonicida subsp. salmonicida]|nr:hypothetical protein BHG40_02810 [Aeromonas salmonicida subsp. masoucida]KTA85592.1 hypothetical protein VO70_05920 [Aeromonas salmonicida]KTA92550.1 hypothetical protein VO71_13260 [Aeromonas salmonicida subsp. smithia]OAH75534.1 hypothetical protein AXW81_13715 [Aeromonas salmonicida subsp. salmonicida]OAH80911.1 hypothetical protein AXW79_20490 [Aeromonas salmonicida subsp. salmonicida]